MASLTAEGIAEIWEMLQTRAVRIAGTFGQIRERQKRLQNVQSKFSTNPAIFCKQSCPRFAFPGEVLAIPLVG